MRLKTKHNAIAVTAQLLKKIKIKVSDAGMYQSLTEHPDYPSLQAISDGLNGWNVPHTSVKIHPDQYSSEDMSFPFMAHVKGNEFILVQAISGAMVYYSNEKQNHGKMRETEFLTIWDGVILYAEKGEESGEINYKNAVLKGWFEHARLPFLIILILACILNAISHADAFWSYFVLLGIKLAGVSVSVLLLMHSIDANNPFIQNLCSLGKKNNCNAILKSDAAKITNWLSWSEIGFFYFAGTFLSLLIVPSSSLLLVWLNLFSLPYTFYSIYYQYKHKNWCLLCCTIQGLLWLEALTFALHTSFTFNVPALSLLAFLLPVAIWSVLKPFFLKATQAQPLKKQLKKFKYNSDLFNQLLTSQPCYAVSDELMPVILGNPEAETTITIVSNPFCGPCASAHKILDNWLAERDDLQLKVIFTTADHDDDQKTKVARHVTALSLLNDALFVEKALSDWYAQKDKQYDKWAASYPVSFNLEIAKVTEKQKQWCDGAEITFTPTILINGYKLMEPYRLEDIKYLI